MMLVELEDDVSESLKMTMIKYSWLIF